MWKSKLAAAVTAIRARDAQRVAEDVLRGTVSRNSARDIFGVALDADGAVMATETQTLRAAVKN